MIVLCSRNGVAVFQELPTLVTLVAGSLPPILIGGFHDVKYFKINSYSVIIGKLYNETIREDIFSYIVNI